MAQDKPKTRLVDLVLNEVSFVPAGDNPEAKVMLMKSKPNQGKPMENENAEAVSKADLAAEVAKREALEKRNAEIQKQLDEMVEKSAVEAITKAAKDAALDPALVPHLRTVQKSAPDAYTAIMAAFSDLSKRTAAAEKLSTRLGGEPAPVTKSAAQIKMDNLIAAEVAKGIPHAQAAVNVYTANPELYNEVARG